MRKELEKLLPQDIEKRSFEIISQELNGRHFDAMNEPIIKRVIHTTADFDYADNLCFIQEPVECAKKAIRSGVGIVTDTQMALAGINRKILKKYGNGANCYMSDEDVAKEAIEGGTTRAVASMNKAAINNKGSIYAIGNAPTALIRLYELIQEGIINPALIIAVPVGFVNVEEAKQLILRTHVPIIVSKGRKGGSTVAAAIVNAILYSM